MKKTIFVLFLSICLRVNGQNLVPNPDFESYGTLPCSWITSQGQFSSALQDWEMPTEGSTDIFSTLVNQSCYAHCQSTYSNAVGEQLPRSGNIMSSILTYGSGCSIPYREYLEVQLTSPLIAGETYYAEMFVSHGDYSQFASNNIGMYFSDTYVNNPGLCGVLNFVPQINETSVITDSTNWVKIAGNFVATSPAQYLIIGNFYDNNNTVNVFCSPFSSNNARYFVDDVLVMNVSAPPLPVELLTFNGRSSGNVNIIEWSTATEKNNDFFTILRSKAGDHFESIGTVKGAGNSIQILNYSFTDRQPLSGINYYRLLQTDYDGKTSLSEIISVDNSFVNAELISFASNSISEELQIVLNLPAGSEVVIIIYNLAGQLFEDLYRQMETGMHTIRLPVAYLPEGIYFINCVAAGEMVTKKVSKM